MNINNYIIRTRKFSKLKIPYLKITSLSSNKKNKKEENNINWSQTQKDINNDNIKKIKDNEKINKFKNKFENLIKYKNDNIQNEKVNLKSLISNNITIISKKYITQKYNKRKKIMIDGQTNTEPIVEEINILPPNIYENNKNNNIDNNIDISIDNNIDNNYIEIKKEEKPKTKTVKVFSLKKKLKSSSNFLVQSEKIINKNLGMIMKRNIDKKNINLPNQNFFSSIKNIILDDEEKKVNTNIFPEKKEIKNKNKNKYDDKNEIKNKITKSKINDKRNDKNNLKENKISENNLNNIINNINNQENNSIIKININENNKSFNDNKNKNKNKNKKYNIRNRNILTAINFSQGKDRENPNYNHQYIKKLLNKNYIYDYKKIINKKKNNFESMNEELKINSLIYSEELKKNETKLILSNKLYHLREKNIKFSPCRYNLFNVPVIENNNSLEETIKQQTVSNFNNKYNLKYKTKNPKEKEKIKTLFNMLKKHKDSEFQKKIDLKKYNSIKKKYKIYIDDNKQTERPKTGYLNKLKINNKYSSNKKLDNYVNKKMYNMISIKTMNFLEN